MARYNKAVVLLLNDDGQYTTGFNQAGMGLCWLLLGGKMSIFRCEECGCVENTAVSGYWFKDRKTDGKSLCSKCDPNIGKWHGIFSKQSADGYMLGNDGFLYSKKYVESGDLKWREEHQGFKIVGPA